VTTRRLFGATLTLSAFLLFLVQPMVARAILPWFGGSASLWTTCMMVFQATLLLGYLYSYVLVRFAPIAGQFGVHAGLLFASALALPPLPDGRWQPADLHNPSAQASLLLVAVAGLPYLALSTTAPLLQAWHARLFPERSPYRLYAWSNASSLAALLAYPLLIEPSFTLRQQGLLWSGLYLGFVAVCLPCAYAAMKGASPARAAEPSNRDGTSAVAAEARRPRWAEVWVWLWLAFLASVALLGVTNELCHDVAVVPFLWVGPLSLYLATFVVCFRWERFYRRRVFLPLSLLCIWGMKSSSYLGADSPLPTEIAIWCATLFVFCTICHGELVRRKPHADHLTLFYVAVALGGALGGAAVALAAPRLFSSFLELPLGLAAIVVTAALLFGAGEAPGQAQPSRSTDTRKARKKTRAPAAKPGPIETPARRWRWVTVYLVAAGAITAYVRPSGRPQNVVLDQRRNFFGVTRVEAVTDRTGSSVRWLYSGRTAHGVQFQQPRWARFPTAYYAARSGVGLALASIPRRTDRHIGVVGLGAGTMAAYGRRGDRLRFYEINPLVRDLAQQYFTFLSGCPCRVDIVMGDGRVSLAREAPQGFDLLALDAFTGDSIPTHLLTAEALQVYLRHLRPDGILAVHISNAYFDLRPVLRGLAEAGGLSGMMVVNEGNEAELVFDADWVLLSRDPSVLARPALQAASSPAWQGVTPLRWTDDFVSLPALLGRLPDS
jgi:hypothetical protein